MSHDRRWWPAVLLTLLMSGLGHVYAGRARLGLLIYLALSACFTLIAVLGLFARSWLLLSAGLAVVAVLRVVVIIHAGVSAEGAAKPYKPQFYNRWWVYVLLLLVAWFVWPAVVKSLLRHNVVEAFKVPSSSMAPAIQAGDYFFVDKRPAARRIPTYNEVIVFQSLSEPGVSVIKRVVGLPGDTLATRDGQLYRNGRAVKEAWITPVSPTDTMPLIDESNPRGQAEAVLEHYPTLSRWGPTIVPQGAVYVLGDNRSYSYDSRYWGPVSLDRILGRPLWIYFNLARDDLGYRTRWERVGTRPWVVQPN